MFEGSFIIGTPMVTILSERNLINSEVLYHYFGNNEFGNELIQQVETLRHNQYINRSSVLHRKKGKLNTIALKMLLKGNCSYFSGRERYWIT